MEWKISMCLEVSARYCVDIVKFLCVRRVSKCVCVCAKCKNTPGFCVHVYVRVFLYLPELQSHPVCQSVLQVKSFLQSSHQSWQSSIHRGTSKIRSLRQL